MTRLTAPIALAATLATTTPVTTLKAQAPAVVAPADSVRARREDVATADALIAALYDVISGPAGQKRDWNRFRSLFAPQAKLIPTAVRQDGSAVLTPLTVEEYITRAGASLEKMGFFEVEIGRNTEQFDRVMHAFSAYASRRNATDAEPFSRGINSIQLFNDGTRWWVVNIFWGAERPGALIPREMVRRN
ncbi:MAG: hypothetical protein MUF00_11050 [Gemmatimonadaceae bacterium]|jgi:hypothetical protein|nr:hypothetical protein [Gemmatimonadaceae bacterium]